MKLLRIASRESPLALRQTELVKAALQKIHPGLEIEIIGMTTEGDRRLDTSLINIGGKGLFVKELENAILEGRADIAVHSIKDITTTFPDGLMLGAICEREDPRDVFISNKYASFADLPAQAIVGTSSLRRQCQLLNQYLSLRVQPLRGNVNTRLKKLDDGEYDAIILAAAGLHRLALESRITQYLSIEESIPAVGQGALGIECRTNDPDIYALISALDHVPTRTCILAERAMNATLGGNCHVPIGGHATLDHDEDNNGMLTLKGMVGYPDGRQLLKGEVHGQAKNAETIGTLLAYDLLAQGAGDILEFNEI
jgi:hydroxymethylbilane synthase